MSVRGRPLRDASDSCVATPAPTAIDLFAGAGGATQGLSDAGVRVIGAVESDPIAARSYRLNHGGVHLWETDIRRLTATSARRVLQLERGELTLLKACPPCQGFSSLAEGRIGSDDPRNDLVGHTVRFIRELRPKSVIVENVPGLGRDRRSSQLVDSLNRLGYTTRLYYVNAVDFGVPQRRKRLIILGVRGRNRQLPDSLGKSEEKIRTVREAFLSLSRSIEPGDPLNEHRRLSSALLERVQGIPPEGNRFSLPEELQLECHKKLDREGKKAASGSYSRLKWDAPAPTMTTRCTTPACGPFLHPTEHRPITLREAAAIQTFPATYKFNGSRGDIERQIGNAVPVKMAQGLAQTLLASLY